MADTKLQELLKNDPAAAELAEMASDAGSAGNAVLMGLAKESRGNAAKVNSTGGWGDPGKPDTTKYDYGHTIDTPITGLRTDKAGNPVKIVLSSDFNTVSPPNYDAPANATAAQIKEGAKQFFHEVGFDKGGFDGNRLFDRYMAGDPQTVASIRNVLLSPSNPDAKAWGQQVWNELEQNRGQYQAALKTESAGAPVVRTPMVAAGTPKNG